MKRLIIVAGMLVLTGCALTPRNMSPQQLHDNCRQKMLVYVIKPYKGGHIIGVMAGRYRAWYFDLHKPDSVQEGKWIETIRVFVDNKKR